MARLGGGVGESASVGVDEGAGVLVGCGRDVSVGGSCAVTVSCAGAGAAGSDCVGGIWVVALQARMDITKRATGKNLARRNIVLLSELMLR